MVLVGVIVLVGPGVEVIVGLARNGINSASALHPDVKSRMKTVTRPNFHFDRVISFLVVERVDNLLQRNIIPFCVAQVANLHGQNIILSYAFLIQEHGFTQHVLHFRLVVFRVVERTHIDCFLGRDDHGQGHGRVVALLEGDHTSGVTQCHLV